MELNHSVSSNLMSVYKEVQIHGPIDFSKHIAACVISPSDKKGVEDLIEAFSTKHGVPIIEMEGGEGGGVRGRYRTLHEEADY